MRASRTMNQRGGAVVEFAVFTLVFVPLAMYGIWMGDVMHLGVRAEEASITPAFDSTAALVHDFESGGGTKAQAAVDRAKQQQMNRMQSSFDAANPSASYVAQTVFARPQNLKIDCQNKGPSGSAALFKINKSNDLQPTQTYVTCSAELHAVTATGAGHFSKVYADQGKAAFTVSKMFDLKVCGVGPGWTGCEDPKGSSPPNGIWGLPIYLDDWGTEKGDSAPLLNKTANKAYYNVTEKYYLGGITPAPVMALVAGLGDLGPTAQFRMSYIRQESDGSYSPTQSNAGHGGPPTQHMGGEWHSEVTTNIAENTFNARDNETYMAVKGWPQDR